MKTIHWILIGLALLFIPIGLGLLLSKQQLVLVPKENQPSVAPAQPAVTETATTPNPSVVTTPTPKPAQTVEATPTPSSSAGISVPPSSSPAPVAQPMAVGQTTPAKATPGLNAPAPASPKPAGDFTTTADGLKYQILKPADPLAPSVALGDNVTIAYQGSFTNGTVFNSSPDGHPFTFVLGRGTVIRGWEEGIPGMQIGERRKLIIPPVLGLGEKGSDIIPPNTTLVYEIQLISKQ